jgi:hypothetical protein
MSKLHHPNVVRFLGLVYEVEIDGSKSYSGFLMEKMDVNLLEFMRRWGCQPKCLACSVDTD